MAESVDGNPSAQIPSQMPAGIQQQQEVAEIPQQPKRPPLYTLETGGGHYGACMQLATNDKGADPANYQGAWANVCQGLNGIYKEVLATYWQSQIQEIEDADHDYKVHHLPLARIKKVMKSDPEVKMISAEAPILFAKGCEIFITELTMRAWTHAEENKRRTLQRTDISAALTKSDMFDFLIDIVPREEAREGSSKKTTTASAADRQTAVAPPQQDPSRQPQMMHPGYPPYPGAGGMPPEQDYRSTPQMYSQPQIFDPQMYGYIPGQQPMYQMPPGRPQDQPPPQDQGHHQFRQQEVGEAYHDAEGERDDDVA